jgi:phosphatidylglycerophosphate synthase
MRWRDLYTWATAITLLRLGIGCVVSVLPFSWLLPLYLLALLSDVADGAVARATGTQSAAGAVLDGWVDKILHVNLAWRLAVEDRFPDWWMLCYFSRELVQAPMVPLLTRQFRLQIGSQPKTSFAGRFTAISIALSLVLVLMGKDATVPTLMTGVGGLWSAIGYFQNYLLPWWRSTALGGGGTPPGRLQ